jgi:DNA ligase-1
MLLNDIVETSLAISGTRKRLVKIERLADLLRSLKPEEVPIGVAYLSGVLPQGRIGIGPAAIRAARPQTSVADPALSVVDVDTSFERITTLSGPGSTKERTRLLKELLSRATRDEQEFLVRLIFGDLRQGALEGIMVEAIAKATAIAAAEVRRAVMICGDAGPVARVALSDGIDGVKAFRQQIFQPVQPMLAQTAQNVEEALERLERASFEYKLDGARVQVHKSGDDVRIFTRRLNDVTVACPEVVESVRRYPVREVVLDGEVLALREDETPHPFQVTMKRFGRRLDVERMRKSLPLTPFFFDCLFIDGEGLVDRTGVDRFDALRDAVPEVSVIPRIVTSDVHEARRFSQAALDAGHEGVMAKALDAPYDAGGRGYSWLKVKPVHTLDLVVLAAEWGSGRRRGWLSNLHLGARDEVSGEFIMLGKTFKGMTDEILKWQTDRLQELEISRDKWTVYVRPELVVEVAFSDIQTSPQYPAGMALRFARIKGYRTDKVAAEADTIEAVRALHQGVE